MGKKASQITSLTIVHSPVYSGADQRKHQAPRHWPLCGEFAGDRCIPRTNGQLRGKCFHLMTSSWICQRLGTWPATLLLSKMFFVIISIKLSIISPSWQWYFTECVIMVGWSCLYNQSYDLSGSSQLRHKKWQVHLFMQKHEKESPGGL